MSESVACALEHTGGREVEGTVKFIRRIDRFFDSECNKPCQWKKEKKTINFQSPYTSSEDFRVKVCLLFFENDCFA